MRKTIVAAAFVLVSALAPITSANATETIVPCGSDLECFELNPNVHGYGTDKFFNPNDTVTPIAEDDPAFNCATMGNLQCGSDGILQVYTMQVWMGNTYNV